MPLFATFSSILETFLSYFTPIHLFSLYCFLKYISFLIFYNLNHDYSNLSSYLAISRKLSWVTPAFISFFSLSHQTFLGCCSVAQSCPALCHPMAAAHQASLSSTVSRIKLKPMSIELVTPPNHLILCRPLLPPSIFPSIRVFSN